MSKVALQGVTKSFGSIKAVDDVTLELDDREFLVVLGPSGCGKTTLLRIVAGLVKPERGRVYIDGVDVTDTEPYDRNVAMVFQNYALYPHMSVFDNIAFPLKMKKLNKHRIEQRVKDVAQLLQISELLTRKPYELSGGQQQRVALARALVRNPKVFLFDEPLSNLDAKLRVQMREEIKKFHLRFGITTIYVTHDQTEAMALGSKIAVMNHGKIVQLGSPLEVYKNPKNVFVASFLGSPPMNLVEARVVALSGTRVKISIGSQSLQLEQTALANFLQKEVLLGFRPSEVTLSYDLKNSLSASLSFLEPLGDEFLLHVSVEGNECVIKTEEFKEQSVIRFKPRVVYIFEKEKGECIASITL
ncbi:hypothetical protein B9Q12_03095 [Candidatus Marsarchaeota G2 archaeon ECH_B_SAG-G06]|uniref:ABC transporter domain-containing protein n=1 Tax=Candidatus Marsarchaeota G2 archaeon ECH_B_SAG-G06 TaxID=1978166 RepID=A0A2R6BZK2_9ARCH|nr:MAG: hypothetical protein B9Q12_03095 [Candidatus Marsarchaeota G2 archaeon ECH_B_SAG-G06]